MVPEQEFGPFIESVEQYHSLVHSTGVTGRPLVISFIDTKEEADSFVELVYASKIAEYPQLMAKKCDAVDFPSVAEACEVT